ncbi:hypothetical protein F5H01DRAFT_325436 [Linnemannia elongata]|nr:hypothetical protein F5H01DRAFT_325436 [Linnemannia elongata]
MVLLPHACLWSDMHPRNNTPESITAIIRHKPQIRHIKTTDPSLLLLLVFTRPTIQTLRSLDLCLHNEVPDDSPICIWSSEELKEAWAMTGKRLKINEECLRDHLGENVSHEVVAAFSTASYGEVGENNDDNEDPPELPRPIPPDGLVYFEEELEQNEV